MYGILKGKNILVGVTGGIACYKACELTSGLVKLGANVDVIMTKNAVEFVAPLTFETLSKRPVITDMFHRETPWEVQHISLAKKADLIVIAPATANIIAKLRYGIADDMLTTTCLASKAKMLICPAMNEGMLTNPATADNIAALKARSVDFIEPETGNLACGDVGKGRLAEPDEIIKRITAILVKERDLEGKRVLITLGGTEESIDAVRVITNHSSGKMGAAIAAEAISRGAEVTLIAGRVSVPLPDAHEIVRVRTTDEMARAALERCGADYVIMAAAPSDYKAINAAKNKIKAEKFTLELEKNIDIAAEIGKNKKGKLIIFSAETDDLIANAVRKMNKKNADLVVANDVTQEGAGFNSDTNIVTLIKRDGSMTEYGKMPKCDVARIIIDALSEL